MGAQSKIEWTDSTFNPWVGCTKVARARGAPSACDFCYAEKWAKRSGQVEWGNHPRRRTTEAYWRNPLAWNNRARLFQTEHGRRQRVFCASLADVFDNQVDPAWRADLFNLIRTCDELEWQLLTKRPQNIRKMLPPDWDEGYPNVWLGTTAENQRWATRRIERLLSVEANVRFLSCEPLLSAIDLTPWLKQKQITWVIAGGESGHFARPTHPNWIRSLRDQCQRHDVPFHFKQWGHWSPESHGEAASKIIELRDEAGRLERLSWRPKLRSGRVLDGQTWDGYP